MRSTVAIALCLLCSSTSAEIITGTVSGITPQAIWWNGIQANKPFMLTFSLDTSAAAISPTASHGPGPVARDLNTSAFTLKLFVDGVSRVNENLVWAALAGPGVAGTGPLADDSVVAIGLLSPNELFVFSLRTPGLIADPIPNNPLTGITAAGITGLSFGYRDGDEPDISLILLGENLPITFVPEPSTYALAAIGVLGLLAFRRRTT